MGHKSSRTCHSFADDRPRIFLRLTIQPTTEFHLELVGCQVLTQQNRFPVKPHGRQCLGIESGNFGQGDNLFGVEHRCHRGPGDLTCRIIHTLWLITAVRNYSRFIQHDHAASVLSKSSQQKQIGARTDCKAIHWHCRGTHVGQQFGHGSRLNQLGRAETVADVQYRTSSRARKALESGSQGEFHVRGTQRNSVCHLREPGLQCGAADCNEAVGQGGCGDIGGDQLHAIACWQRATDSCCHRHRPGMKFTRLAGRGVDQDHVVVRHRRDARGGRSGKHHGRIADSLGRLILHQTRNRCG